MLTRCARRHFTNAAARRALPAARTRRPKHRTSSNGSEKPPTNFLPEGSQQKWPHPFLPGILLITLLGTGYSLYKQQDRRDGFNSFVLVKKEPVSPTASIFYLEPKDGKEGLEVYQDAWRKGIWNFQFKQPQIQVVRAYTPLPSVSQDGQPKEQFRFLIRNERNGEVSGWLHRLPVGSEIELRGPNLEYQISQQTEHIIFLAGGTGIASALQAAYAILPRGKGRPDSAQASNEAPRISILWANRRRDDCLGGVSQGPSDKTGNSWWKRSVWFSTPLSKSDLPSSIEKNQIVKELEALQAKNPGRVTVEYFVDAEGTFINKDAIIKALSGPESRRSSEQSQSLVDTQIIISGPEGFVRYFAGPKEWRNGREEQGPIDGIVAQALLKSSRPIIVWKV